MFDEDNVPVVFAILDGNYSFVYANIGCQGRISDGGVLDATSFKQSLDDATINLPALYSFRGRTMATPYVYFGDDAFPLFENLMQLF